MATVFTVGHSTRSADELITLLAGAGIEVVADVRRLPRSRRHPQHGRNALERALAAASIGYVWLGEGLGGRQPEHVPAERSPNRAWREPAFRHYADAMATPAFAVAFGELEALAAIRTTALLCAERDWRRCHRQLLADLLLARGWRVVHLGGMVPGEEHRLTPFARVDDGGVTYPTLL